MDYRIPLKLHTVLDFEGMSCHVEEVIGQGSNAIVYKGWYRGGNAAVSVRAGGLHDPGTVPLRNDSAIRNSRLVIAGRLTPILGRKSPAK